MQWLTDNLSTIIIGLILLAVVVLIIISMIKKKQKGGSSCSCGCADCPYGSSCSSAAKVPDKK